MSTRIEPIGGLAVAGSASAFPERRYDGDAAWRALLGPDFRAELARRGQDPERPAREWGVERRGWSVVPGERGDGAASASELLAARAARAALADAGLDARELGLVAVATSTPGRISSSLAARLCRELGTEAPGLDLRAGGAGGLQAWTVAATMMRAGAASALVVASEAPSEYLSPGDPGALLYGDGAGALVLRRVDAQQRGLGGALLGHASVDGRAFTVPGRLPPTREELDSGRYRFQTPDAEYARGLGATWERAARELGGLCGEGADLVACGATRAQIELAEAAFGGRSALTRRLLGERGATGCAAPLLALDAARRGGELSPGRPLALLSVGGGVAWAGLHWRP